MAETKVPGVGAVPKKPALIIGGGAAAYVGYRWWRARGASGGTGVPVPVDTANTAAGAATGVYSNPGGIGGSGASGTGTGAASTNQDWAARVESDLTALAYDPQKVAEAVAAYLGSQPLTLDQQTIIRLAWAWEGKPPGSTNLAIIPAQSNPGTPAPAPAGTPAPAPAQSGPAPLFSAQWAADHQAVRQSPYSDDQIASLRNDPLGAAVLGSYVGEKRGETSNSYNIWDGHAWWNVNKA